MKLTINGEVKVLDAADLNVTGLLACENVKYPETVSVQLNGKFVDRANFQDTTLQTGDSLDFLYFMGGGR